MRLISSGIDRSNDRSPASTWAMAGRLFPASFDATSAHAKVEFTSPTTSSASGFSSTSTGSNRRMISAVCLACDPDLAPEENVRLRQIQFGEEGVRHLRVIMLAG